MTAGEIYQLTPTRTEVGVGSLAGGYSQHVPEVALEDVPDGTGTDVSVRTVHYENFDGRRYWELRTVWFRNLPVMVVQNAGREGDDHTRRFITHPDRYRRMVIYLRGLIPVNEMPRSEWITLEDDIPELTAFHGHRLEDFRPPEPVSTLGDLVRGATFFPSYEGEDDPFGAAHARASLPNQIDLYLSQDRVPDMRTVGKFDVRTIRWMEGLGIILAGVSLELPYWAVLTVDPNTPTFSVIQAVSRLSALSLNGVVEGPYLYRAEDGQVLIALEVD